MGQITADVDSVSGIGGAYLSFTVSNGINDTDVTAVDIVPALFIDVVTSAYTRIYLVPKMVRRAVILTGQSDEFINYLGRSVGFKWGNDSGFFVEYTLLQGAYTPKGFNVENDVDLSQFALDFFF